MASFLKIAEYEKQYQKNFTMIKAKYRNQICANLSCINSLNFDQFSKEKNDVQKKKKYFFLCFLSFFEVDYKKPHEFFVLLTFYQILNFFIELTRLG